MNLGRLASVNILRKARQLETLVKPGNLLARRYNCMEFQKSSSSLANPNHRVILNGSNHPKYHILSKLPAQLTTGIVQTRTASTHGDHVRLWVVERLVSVSLLALIPAALIFENRLIDSVLAINVVMHTHWGLEAIILDYVRPIVVGTLVPKLAFVTLNIISIATLAGLLILIFNGPGLSKTIKRGWAIGADIND